MLNTFSTYILSFILYTKYVKSEGVIVKLCTTFWSRNNVKSLHKKYEFRNVCAEEH